MNRRLRDTLLDPLLDNNPIALQVLGICSALAVTKLVSTALVMSGAVLFVLASSNFAVSLLRHRTPPSIRIVVELAIITSLVIVTDQVLKAYLFDISLRLSVFVGLIITNCIVLGRAEAFAMQNAPLPSLLDGVGNALGYGLVLTVVGTARELLGAGTLLGVPVLPADGGWFVPNALMGLAPSGFLLIGCFVWALRAWKPEQREEVPRAGALFEPGRQGDLHR
jgi:Na+-transporting NADH:ubiquinone oxidoreductase subunit D